MAHGLGRAGLDFRSMGRAGPINRSIAHGLTFLKPARPIRSSGLFLFVLAFFYEHRTEGSVSDPSVLKKVRMFGVKVVQMFGAA